MPTYSRINTVMLTCHTVSHSVVLGVGCGCVVETVTEVV